MDILRKNLENKKTKSKKKPVAKVEPVGGVGAVNGGGEESRLGKDGWKEDTVSQEEHDKKQHLGKWATSAVMDAKMVKKIARAKDLLLKVQNSLSVTSIILGYTFIKWTFVLIHYLQDGEVPERNLFLLFMMVPFGVPIFVIGIIKQVIAIFHMKKAMDVLKEGVNHRSLVFIVTNYVLMVFDLVEMILIFVVAS